jgi:4-diphosphocytidyl-2-C-methyl-D-erythritol kinase
MTTWPAPAKLNLFLHVVGRRADGYHLLQTVFQFLDYGDELRFEVTPDSRIGRAAELPGIPEEADLTVRAARLLQEATGSRRGAVIHLRKRIPAGGGLGGGSSDAATTLIALNRLWGLDLPVTDLAVLGLRLGADVPVFVRGRAAWAEGVGEILTPIELPQPWYVVLAPPVQVATAGIFADPHLTRDTPPITIRAFLTGQGQNDLEPVVRRRYPEVDQALRWLGGFGPARMTGSGSCVFLAVANRDDAERILAQTSAPLTGFVARGMNRHPIYKEGNEIRDTRVEEG